MCFNLSLKFKSSFKRCLQKISQPFSLGGCKFKEMKSLIEKESSYDQLIIKEHRSSSKWLFIINPIVYGYGLKN